jgi:hypothetical protein
VKLAYIELPLEWATGFAFATATLYGAGGIYEARLLLDTGAALMTLSLNLAFP